MTRLTTRVLALERRARQAVGCPLCRGRFFGVFDPSTDDLSWLDERSYCRGCGEGVKVFYRDLWEKLG
jgi:hypothetical protein